IAISFLFFIITAIPNLLGTNKGDSPTFTTQIDEEACGDVDLPNIIVISFDSLAAQDMSLYGYDLPTTPFWEEMARFSFVFDRAHSNSNRTLPSLSTLLTGKYPWSHGVYKEGDHVREDKVRENLLALLPEYCSAAIISTNYAYPQFMGLDNQFDYVRWSNKGNSFAMVTLTRFLERSLRTPVFQIMMPGLRHYFYLNSNEQKDKEIYGETFDRSREFLKKLSKKPFFLWTHIWPPHLPYLPPDPFKKKFLPIDDDDSFMLLFPAFYKPSQQHLVDKLRLRYDELILFSDYRLKKFVRDLIDLELYDESIVIILGDHGEGFEKLWFSHGGHLLNEPVIHIPLLIKMPRQNKGVRIKAVAGVVDVAPTILDMLGRQAPEWMDGESLLPYMKDRSLRTPVTKYSMINAEFKDMTVDLVAAYRDNYKLIYDLRTDESLLYNMKLDVAESRDLKDIYPEIARSLKEDIMRDIERKYFDQQ
ncbi:MAG: sulfatase, partial [Proteobacteria bacterium]|nr:sulfatase [Pseudomonadota bacterium]